MNKGFTVWFTGLPGSGKTTLAQELELALLERGLSVEVLDGEIIRTNISSGLTFSKEDRDQNVRRIGYVCQLLSRNSVAAIAAAIAPYQAARQENRQAISRYVEVYCRRPLEALIAEDPKGLYQKAKAGEITSFTGISDPYEEPLEAEIIVETDQEAVTESLAKVLCALELKGYIPAIPGESSYSAEEEERLKARLKDLGYL